MFIWATIVINIFALAAIIYSGANRINFRKIKSQQDKKLEGKSDLERSMMQSSSDSDE